MHTFWVYLSGQYRDWAWVGVYADTLAVPSTPTASPRPSSPPTTSSLPMSRSVWGLGLGRCINRLSGCASEVSTGLPTYVALNEVTL